MLAATSVGPQLLAEQLKEGREERRGGTSTDHAHCSEESAHCARRLTPRKRERGGPEQPGLGGEKHKNWGMGFAVRHPSFLHPSLLQM